MTVVVPPRRAARLPEAKPSAVTVPATSRSKWVWASMKPGKRTQPVTSTVRSASALSPRPRETTFSPSTNRSARRTPLPETTLPPLNNVRICCPSVPKIVDGDSIAQLPPDLQREAAR